jgi:hypothetical protein
MTMTNEQLAEAVKRIAELNAKRRPYDWHFHQWPNIGPDKDPSLRYSQYDNTKQGWDAIMADGYLIENADASGVEPEDLEFMAEAPLMATIIAQLWDEREQQRTELRSALYPGGIKHPDQAKWQWLIERVKEQREALEFIELLGVEPNDLPDGERISRAKRAASKALRLITSQPKEQNNDR